MKALDKPDSPGYWWYRVRYNKEEFISLWFIINVHAIDKNGEVFCFGEAGTYYFPFEVIGRKAYYQFVKAEPPPNDLV